MIKTRCEKPDRNSEIGNIIFEILVQMAEANENRKLRYSLSKFKSVPIHPA